MIFMIKNTGSLGIAVIVTPAVALLAGGSATAAGTGGSSRQLVKTRKIAQFRATEFTDSHREKIIGGTL